VSEMTRAEDEQAADMALDAQIDAMYGQRYEQEPPEPHWFDDPDETVANSGLLREALEVR